MRKAVSETPRNSIAGCNLSVLIILLSSLAISTAAQAADPVGTVKFVRGDVTIETAGGETAKAEKDDSLMQGERITTGVDGIAVIELKDDSRMVLRPRSDFRVERLVTEEDSADIGIKPSAVLNLLRGGLRLVTGLIGRANPAGYRLNTPVATIGIRGTEFNSRICTSDCANEERRLAGRGAADNVNEGLYVNVDDGGIFLDNDAPGDPLNLDAGESGYVAGSNSLPVRLDFVPAFQRLDGIPSPSQLDFDNIEMPDVELQAQAPEVDTPEIEAGAATDGEAAALAAVTASDGDDARTGVTGSYEIDVEYGSDLPSSDRKWFFGASPDIEVSLTQDGNHIKGVLSGDREGVIEGKLDREELTYKIWLEAQGGEVKEGEGVWIVQNENQLKGDFNIRDRERGIIRGKVTLTRVGTSSTSAFGLDILLGLIAFVSLLRLAGRRLPQPRT